MKSLPIILTFTVLTLLIIVSGCDVYVKAPVKWKEEGLTFQATEGELFSEDLMNYVDYTSTPVFKLGENAPGWIDLNGSKLEGTPDEGNAKVEEKFTVEASSDGYSKTIDVTINVEFKPKFDAEGPFIWNVNEYKSIKISAHDKNGDPLIFSTKTDLPPKLTLKSDGTLEGTPVSSPKQPVSVTIIVSDGKFETAKNFDVIINIPPEWKTGNLTVYENTEKTFDLTDYATDEFFGDLTFEFEGISSLGTETPLEVPKVEVNGTALEISASCRAHGKYELRLSARDGIATSEATFELNVIDVNCEPVLTDEFMEEIPASSGVKFEYTLNDWAEDPDGDCLVFSKDSGPDWVTIESTLTEETSPCYLYTLEGTPSATGTFLLKLGISDGENKKTAQSTIVVSE